jgi:hypothetical protein
VRGEKGGRKERTEADGVDEAGSNDEVRRLFEEPSVYDRTVRVGQYSHAALVESPSLYSLSATIQFLEDLRLTFAILTIPAVQVSLSGGERYPGEKKDIEI